MLFQNEKENANLCPLVESKKLDCPDGSCSQENEASSGTVHSLPPTWISGETVRFTQHDCCWDLLIERLPDNYLHSQKRGERETETYRVAVESREDLSARVCVSLARSSSPYQRLRINNSEKGSLDWRGRGGDKDSCWVVTPLATSISKTQLQTHEVTLCHTSYSKKKGQGREYTFILSSRGGGWVALPVGSVSSPGAPPSWKVEALQPMMTGCRAGGDKRDSFDLRSDLHSNLRPAPALSDPQLHSFLHNGFLVLRQKVPMDVLRPAQRAVNSRLGRPGCFVASCRTEGTSESQRRRPPSGFDEVSLPLEESETSNGAVFNGRMDVDASYDPELLEPARCPEVRRIITQLLGRVMPINGVQVALRFPGEGNDVLVMSGAAMKCGISGDSWHTDGLRQGKKHSFSLLVGVALSDMSMPNNGNLCVWPKSHLHIHHWMRHPDGMIRRIPAPAELVGGGDGDYSKKRSCHVTSQQGYREGTRAGTESVEGYLDSDGSLPNLGPPVQVTFDDRLDSQLMTALTVIAEYRLC